MSDIEIEIRAAGSADIGDLVTIGNGSFRAAYEDLSNTQDIAEHLDAYFSAAAISREMATPDRRYLVATVNNEPAGMAKIREGNCPDTIPHGDSIELQQLYVLPGNQRYGIGGRLVRAVAQIAASNAAPGVWLSVWEDADWATSFYRKLGFTEVGTAEFRIGKAIYTDFLMWLPVDAG